MMQADVVAPVVMESAEPKVLVFLCFETSVMPEFTI